MGNDRIQEKKYTEADMIRAMRYVGNFAAKWAAFEPGRPIYMSDIDREALKYLQSLNNPQN